MSFTNVNTPNINWYGVYNQPLVLRTLSTPQATDTLTASMLIGGILIPSQASSWTLDTAANILKKFNIPLQTNMSFVVYFMNPNSYQITLAPPGDASITIYGDNTVSDIPFALILAYNGDGTFIAYSTGVNF